MESDNLEKVAQRLTVLRGSAIEDDDTQIKIATTLLRLPDDVREKTTAEMLFVFGSFGGELLTMDSSVVISRDEFDAVGTHYITRITKPVIMLNFNDNTHKCKENSIAHEIAHFILGHHKKEKLDGTEEKEADDLSKKWGFARAYERR
jgi:Zn-dependent peptidase ImmA (M78 family)